MFRHRSYTDPNLGQDFNFIYLIHLQREGYTDRRKCFTFVYSRRNGSTRRPSAVEERESKSINVGINIHYGPIDPNDIRNDGGSL